MQFSLVAFFAAMTGVAMAMPLHNARATCDAAKCSIALAPYGFTCAGAAVQSFANPVTDGSCISGALNQMVNTPAACLGCKADAKTALDKVGSDITGAYGSAKSAIGSVF